MHPVKNPEGWGWGAGRVGVAQIFVKIHVGAFWAKSQVGCYTTLSFIYVLLLHFFNKFSKICRVGRVLFRPILPLPPPLVRIYERNLTIPSYRYFYGLIVATVILKLFLTYLLSCGEFPPEVESPKVFDLSFFQR
jgi:hypothetical protein